MRLLIVSLLSSSLGKKFIMSLTGLAALGFLIMHLGGNLVVFAGPSKFNAYAHFLDSMPFIGAIEIALFVLFAIHAFFGIMLALQNWSARPIRYSLRKASSLTDVAPATMIYTGLLVLGFLAVHMWTINLGVSHSIPAYNRVLDALTNPVSLTCYVLGILALGLHLFHGAGSTLQSLGLNHRKYDAFIRFLGRAGAVALAIGFVSIPIYVEFFRRGLMKQ